MIRSPRVAAAHILFAAISITAPGCIASVVHHAVPVCQLDCQELLSTPRDALVPIDFGLLGQPKPRPRRLMSGDVVSVYIEGVLPSSAAQIPVVTRGESFTQIYYPPEGSIRVPSVGVPLEVNEAGTITLPFLGEFPAINKTVPELRAALRDALIERGVLKADRERMFLTLIKEGTRRIVIFREDTPDKQPVQISQIEVPYTKIGNGQVVDLPVYQNDLLHALAASGGLPGIDAVREVLILRHQETGPDSCEPLRREGRPIVAADAVKRMATFDLIRSRPKRIPLAIYPGEALNFGPQDVILRDGDIVYLPKREEYFYTAGLLPGRRVPMPRDRDIDILQAITLAAGNFGAPTGITGSGPGNVVTPSLAVIVRKHVDGSQLLIRVDLAKALVDPSERIFVRPDDIVMLEFKKSEALANFLLNFFSFSFTIAQNGVK